MKKNGAGLCCIVLLLLITNPVLTSAEPKVSKPTLATVDREITDLRKRFSILESNVERFQLGGSLVVEPNISPDYNLGFMAINQQLNLFFDAAIDQKVQFSLRMSQNGQWGLASNMTPLTGPLQVDEAFLGIRQKNQQDYLGRFRFSLGQYGLISDLFTNPVEGLVVQQQFGNFYVIGLYSRIGPLFKEEKDAAGETIYKQIGIEDYSAARLGWTSPTTVLGLNLVPNGITGEKAYSVDWSWNRGATEVRAELGWYSFHMAGNEDYQVDWTPGILIGYSKTLASAGLFQLKTGYFSKDFYPSSSSLGHISGKMREWFKPNSKGVEVYLREKIANNWQADNRLILLTPVQNPQPKVNYQLSSSLIRTFSTVNQAQFGIEGSTLTGNLSYRVFLKWNLRF
ncbi:MAG TPA: hypothetical protein VHY08_18740 [Bacillota bacterium]|nr:hypothetical protein [Bacillota bacterium]